MRGGFIINAENAGFSGSGRDGVPPPSVTPAVADGTATLPRNSRAVGSGFEALRATLPATPRRVGCHPEAVEVAGKQGRSGR